MLIERTDSAMAVLIKQLWQTYANTLSLLAATFDIKTLEKVPYLLEEDKEIIGFQPFGSIIVRQNTWLEKTADHGHPNEEMLARIRFLLEDGITLCQRDVRIIRCMNQRFLYPFTNQARVSRTCR